MTEKIARRGLHTFREYAVDPLEYVHVGEAMTRDPETIPCDATVADVRSRYFGEHQQRRAFPVVDEHGRCIAIINRGALRDAPDGDSRPISALLQLVAQPLALESENCRTAASRMDRTGLERLPVVADAVSRRLTGIISRSDLVRCGRTARDEDQRERLRNFRQWLPLRRLH